MIGSNIRAKRSAVELLVIECDRALTLLATLGDSAPGVSGEIGVNACKLRVATVRDALRNMLNEGSDPGCDCEAEFRQALELVRLAKRSLGGA